jgi:TfoX/Sxy family transcriptional regulator of competence genes
VAYDERIAARVRELLAGERQVAEKAMFGRRMFLVAGNLAVGVAGDELMVRVGVKARHAALSEPHTRECNVSKRPMYDWVLVGADALATEARFEGWGRRGVVFARSLANG